MTQPVMDELALRSAHNRLASVSSDPWKWFAAVNEHTEKNRLTRAEFYRQYLTYSGMLTREAAQREKQRKAEEEAAAKKAAAKP